MKQLNDEQVKYIFRTLEPRAEALMEMVRQRPDLNWNAQITELSLIKHILEDLIDEEVPETVTGVLTTPSKEPRPIAELVMELWGHPEYVGGRIFTKDDIMDTIIYDLNADNDLYDEGDEEYLNDDEICDKSEELYKLNGRSISNAIDDICNDAFDGVDFTDYMTYDLSKKEIE
jgi:hypothetical protein